VKRLCSWCKTDMDTGEKLTDEEYIRLSEEATHGMCGDCYKKEVEKMDQTDKLGFKEWFEQNGNDLLRGWIRAREDGNEEMFSDWVLGDYDIYLDPGDVDEDYVYEVPYHGLCDSKTVIEKALGL